MNKKKLLLVLLALAIVTSLSAGTLAIYSKTVTTVDNKVQAKKFVFTANAAKTYKTDFTLAPKDSWSYTFDVANFSGATTAEVALDYTINVNDKDATTTLTGLQTKLEKKIGTGDTSADWITLATSTTGEIKVKDDGIGTNAVSTAKGASAANAQSTSKYKVTLTWVDDENSDAAHTTEGITPVSKGLNVTVTASQNTVSSNITNASGITGTGDNQ
jgi:hypothetical protein